MEKPVLEQQAKPEPQRPGQVRVESVDGFVHDGGEMLEDLPGRPVAERLDFAAVRQVIDVGEELSRSPELYPEAEISGPELLAEQRRELLGRDRRDLFDTSRRSRARTPAPSRRSPARRRSVPDPYALD